MITTTYLHGCFTGKQLMKHINGVVKALQPYCNKFDSIAFRGMSGALVGPAVAATLDKEMIMVRKPKTSHSIHVVEGFIASQSYVIVDDFVSSGATVSATIGAINSWQRHAMKQEQVYDSGLQKDIPITIKEVANCFAGVFYLDNNSSTYRIHNFLDAVMFLNENNPNYKLPLYLATGKEFIDQMIKQGRYCVV